MLIETGRVVAVDPDGLWVETIRHDTCGSCAAQKGCGHGLLNRISHGKRGYIRVLWGKKEIADCTLDDQVRISIPEEVILRGSIIVYLLPLLCMLAGSTAAVRLLAGGQDLVAALGAVLGFSLGLVLVRWHAWRHRQDSALQPTLVEIVRPSPSPSAWPEPLP